MFTHLLAPFDQVRIINLVDRPDRRREMEDQLDRIGGTGANVGFFDAHRPQNPGEFPSLGARGCFESQLAVLRQARANTANSVLVIEDDFDFTRDGIARGAAIFAELAESSWDIFYGAHLLAPAGRRGLALVPPDEPVITASFVAFHGRILPPLVDFMDGILTRRAGSPEYGPMHVDGAYTVFRRLHTEYRTFAAFPSLGKQRRSRSDITPTDMLLDRWAPTRKIAAVLRGALNWFERR